MAYIDGFVAAVPTKIARNTKLTVPDGELTSFPKAVQKRDDETICFSWIVWPSKEARDAGMKKVMADERMKPENNPMPFDGKRLIFGGFETLVEM